MEQSMNRYIGQMLDDRYEILEIIGSGGMSVVYKAMCHKLHRYVAVKILRDEMAADAELKNRFQAEAHAVAMLSQPNIVSVYDVGHSGETEYIVMELIEGITLKQYMKSTVYSAPRRRCTTPRRSARRCSTRTPTASSTGTSSRRTS